MIAVTDNVNYRVIFGPASPTSGDTSAAYYGNATNKILTFNPSTGNLAGVTLVNGSALGTAAYANLGTGASDAAYGNHTHTNMVTGSGLTANYFVVGNGGSTIKTSTMQPTTSSTTWSTSSDVYVPTMKAISSYVTGLGYTSNTGTVTSVGFSAGAGISLSGDTSINTSGTVTITNSGVTGIKIGSSQAST